MGGPHLKYPQRSTRRTCRWGEPECHQFLYRGLHGIPVGRQDHAHAVDRGRVSIGTRSSHDRQQLHRGVVQQRLHGRRGRLCQSGVHVLAFRLDAHERNAPQYSRPQCRRLYCIPGPGLHGSEPRHGFLGGRDRDRYQWVDGDIHSARERSPNPPSVPGAARWNGLNVSGVRVTRNTLNKRWAWQTGGFSIAKSYWEMKSGVDVLVEGNRFLGPGSNIMGPLLVNQDGSSPWTMIKNVVIRNNLMLSSGSINIELGGNYYGLPSGVGGPVTFSNNLLGPSSIRAQGMMNGHGPILWTHNTIRSVTGSMWIQDPTPGTPGVVYRDNVINSGAYWMQGWPATFPGGE